MLKNIGSIGHSVHWRSVKYPLISLILDTTTNKVHPYLSIRSLISTICYVKVRQRIRPSRPGIIIEVSKFLAGVDNRRYSDTKPTDTKPTGHKADRTQS